MGMNTMRLSFEYVQLLAAHLDAMRQPSHRAAGSVQPASCTRAGFQACVMPALGVMCRVEQARGPWQGRQQAGATHAAST